MMLAQLESIPSDLLKNLALIGLALLGAIYYAKQIFFSGKSSAEISPQPLTVEIVKTLHEQFADKKVFEEHVSHNTRRHSQLFDEIDRVEIAARVALDARFSELNKERHATVEKINEQLVFIRENLVEVKTKIQMLNP